MLSSNTKRTIFFIVVACFSLITKAKNSVASTTVKKNSTPYIEFFYTSDQKEMMGLSCGSEQECLTRCKGTEQCQKPVATCLNCVGSKSAYIRDFYNNMGDFTTTCFTQSAITYESEALFKSVLIVPLTISSAYNPLNIKDQGLTDNINKLCPIGTLEPIALAFTNRTTKAVEEIPLIKCGKTLYPLVRRTEDCATKSLWIRNYIRSAFTTQEVQRYNYEAALKLADQIQLNYDILQLSEFAESHYISCNWRSAAVCEKLCSSTLSCTIPLDNLNTANGISAFNKHKWNTCEIEPFTPELLVDYLKAPDSIAFSAQSLLQTYELPSQAGGFSDFGVINSMLSDFNDVFVVPSDEQNPSSSSFLISTAYRKKLEEQMSSFCDKNSDPIIFGKGNRIERVFCRSEKNGYFRILTAKDENCYDKKKSISSNSQGVSK